MNWKVKVLTQLPQLLKAFKKPKHSQDNYCIQESQNVPKFTQFQFQCFFTLIRTLSWFVSLSYPLQYRKLFSDVRLLLQKYKPFETDMCEGQSNLKKTMRLKDEQLRQLMQLELKRDWTEGKRSVMIIHIISHLPIFVKQYSGLVL